MRSSAILRLLPLSLRYFLWLCQPRKKSERNGPFWSWVGDSQASGVECGVVLKEAEALLSVPICCPTVDWFHNVWAGVIKDEPKSTRLIETDSCAISLARSGYVRDQHSSAGVEMIFTFEGAPFVRETANVNERMSRLVSLYQSFKRPRKHT